MAKGCKQRIGRLPWGIVIPANYKCKYVCVLVMKHEHKNIISPRQSDISPGVLIYVKGFLWGILGGALLGNFPVHGGYFNLVMRPE